MADSRDRRAQMREELLARTKASHESKDVSGSFGSYIKPEYQDRLWKKIKEGTSKFSIVPFVAGPDMPIDIKTKQVEVREGKLAYVMDFWAHSNIGPGNDAFICLAKSYGEDCPICEDLREKQKTGDYEDDEVKKWPWAKRRVLYNIYSENPEHKDRGMMLLDASHFNMEAKLQDIARNSTTGDYINYAHIESGPTLGKFIVFVRKGTGRDNTQFSGWHFEDRDYDLKEKDIEEALPLDQVVKISTYEEVAKVYFGRGGSTTKTTEEEEQSPEPEHRPSREERGRASSPVDKSEDIPTTGCPGGGVLGKDIDSLPKCPTCDKWDDCFQKDADERKKSRGQKKQEPESEKQEEAPRQERRERGTREEKKEPEPAPRGRLRR